MTTPLLRARWRMTGGKLRCAWCLEETQTPSVPGESHGICRRHKRELIAMARADAGQGKRWDQIAYSAVVVVVAIVLGWLIVGGCIARGLL